MSLRQSWPQQIKASCSFYIYIQATYGLIRIHFGVVTCHEIQGGCSRAAYLDSICVEQSSSILRNTTAQLLKRLYPRTHPHFKMLHNKNPLSNQHFKNVPALNCTA